ncbi:MAG: hypothetical protein GOMPHAMPRED_007474 [Gomphillus americanus]|uniref:AB hydrolase-1 domain-containing protein n=1 Tax=Gomphillus americanus TaxID=1940652 RepID=A0A8H3ETZ7_9LECA|nr:MAG: hypothetical protein GOMPHAMPRED_007474 [Gomphillus americanus]
MASQNPIILIISGAWHVPIHYAKLKSALEAAGYEVHVPQLPTANGARPPTADLYTDTEFIREFVTTLMDGGRKIIVIMHSYGGQVGTNALHGLGIKERIANGKSGGIIHLVYMVATAYLEGDSMVSTVEQAGLGDMLLAGFPTDEDGIVRCADARVQMFGPDYVGPEIEAYVASMGIWNVKAMHQPIQHSCAWRTIPVTYIHATQDMAMPLEVQVSVVDNMEKEGVSVKTHRLEASHCPHFTHANEVTDVIGGLDNTI